MKKFFFLYLLAGLSFSACEKDDDNKTPDDNNNGGNNSLSVANNTVVAGSKSANLNKAFLNIIQDINAGGTEVFTIYCYLDNATNRTNTLSIDLKKVPSSSTTLTWQSGSNALGEMTPSELHSIVKVDDEQWFGVYTANGYEASGNMDVTIKDGKITFAFEGIELGDDFISSRVSTKVKCGAKITMPLAELQDVTARGKEIDLIPE
jgi:hypothetical protein